MTLIAKRFDMTARLGQCIAKQAKAIRSTGRMPRFKKHIAVLDQRFVKLEPFDGSFEMCVKLGSGVPKLVIPFNLIRKERFEGWTLSKSIRLGYNNGLFIDLIYEKEAPVKRAVGTTIGIDRGFNSMLYTSEGQQIGAELKTLVKSAGKRRKSFHHFIETEENRLLKTLDTDNVAVIVLESLKNVKRGKFSRNMNRLLSFWHYAKVGNRLEQFCEEKGISLIFKSPAYTSQHCLDCGNIDRRNRKGEKFKCLKCGHADNADHVGALNLKTLGLAGAYSLRSLKSKEGNICP